MKNKTRLGVSMWMDNDGLLDKTAGKTVGK